MTTILELNDGNFTETIKEGITLVDFWAPWCAPCRMQGPIVEKVAQQVGADVTIAKVNVDEARQAAMDLGIRAIPTVIVFKEGQQAEQFVGVTDEYTLLNAIENVLVLSKSYENE
ncbi:MAG: thioredoxin [Candidatus Pacebacteria bacterium]|nr:thioredoxin [Candidatus Paceibacterota bacterium]